MSNETNETIVDIVADIRAQNQGLPEDSYALSPLVCDLLSLADRIEAAWNREREAALSAPPRNCDRFINAKDALKAFERETGESMAIEFIKWLFAETKGEAK